mmetsp:Transcript_87434/g.245431  ORF Transcript_87434/g.245431 Transcript_87434/m.245431 type:complete len:81 (+) Transcript_87434:150-392(+)
MTESEASMIGCSGGEEMVVDGAGQRVHSSQFRDVEVSESNLALAEAPLNAPPVDNGIFVLASCPSPSWSGAATGSEEDGG